MSRKQQNKRWIMKYFDIRITEEISDGDGFCVIWKLMYTCMQFQTENNFDYNPYVSNVDLQGNIYNNPPLKWCYILERILFMWDVNDECLWDILYHEQRNKGTKERCSCIQYYSCCVHASLLKSWNALIIYMQDQVIHERTCRGRTVDTIKKQYCWRCAKCVKHGITFVNV